MSIKVAGSLTNNIAEVTAINELKVALPPDEQNAGYAAIAACSDDGNVTGNRIVRELEATEDYRLRTGSDSVMFNEYFAGTNINTSIWGVPIATATVVQAGGYITLNNAGSLVAANGSILRSHRTFPIQATYPMYFEFLANITTLSFNNAQCEFGAGIIGVAPGTAATDGAFFRVTPAGLSCVLTNNGLEITEVTPTAQKLIDENILLTSTNHFLISMNDDSISFWINDAMIARILRAGTSPATTQSQQMGIFARLINTSTNTLTALKLNIAMVSVSVGDMNTDRPWSHKMVGGGGMIQQTPTGLAPARTALWNTWTALPAQITAPSATALGTGQVASLGGIARIGNAAGTLALAADTALILFSYLVPVLTVTVPILPAKNLVLTGLKLSALSRGAAGAAGLCTFLYSLMIGGSNINPATAENGATPVKTARPMLLGSSSLIVSAPVGTQFSPDIQMVFDTPIIYQPGEYIQVMITPMVAYTIAANQEFVFTMAPVGYWE